METTRGRNGGLRLRKEPEEINLGAVVRGTEPDFTMVECFDRTINSCILSPNCELRHVLLQATSAYLQVLDGVTLAHLLKNSNSLRKLTTIQLHPIAI